MKLSHFGASLFALALIAGCSQAEQTVDKVAETTKEVAAETTRKVAQKSGDVSAAVLAISEDADISAAPAGIYKSENTHAYITFQYVHQGYSRPTIRWNEFDATVNLDPSNPAASTLDVVIQADSIDSGVEKFDDHLKNADMFEVETYPTITFKATDINSLTDTSGTVTGDLTIKDVTKPVTLKTTLNKVGEARDGTPMFGISATTQIKRSEWNVGYAVPFVGDDVNIIIEVEFRKEG